MTDSTTLEGGREAVRSEITKVLRYHSEPLPAPERADEFAFFFDRFADARVVLLGEATHGTREFYRARAAITRRLIRRTASSRGRRGGLARRREHRPICAQKEPVPKPASLSPASRPGCGATPKWKRSSLAARHNEPCRRARASPSTASTSTVSALRSFMIGYLERVDPQAATVARQRYGCLTPWPDEPEAYGDGADRQRQSARTKRRHGSARCSSKQLADAKADAEAFRRGAERAPRERRGQYYRIITAGPENWNLRERLVFETLQALMRHQGPRCKAVVWAHNSHIGNAAATEMGWGGSSTSASSVGRPSAAKPL